MHYTPSSANNLVTELKQVAAFILAHFPHYSKETDAPPCSHSTNLGTKLNCPLNWSYIKASFLPCHLNPFALLDICQPRDSKAINLVAIQKTIFSS